VIWRPSGRFLFWWAGPSLRSGQLLKPPTRESGKIYFLYSISPPHRQTENRPRNNRIDNNREYDWKQYLGSPMARREPGCEFLPWSKHSNHNTLNSRKLVLSRVNGKIYGQQNSMQCDGDQDRNCNTPNWSDRLHRDHLSDRWGASWPRLSALLIYLPITERWVPHPWRVAGPFKVLTSLPKTESRVPRPCALCKGGSDTADTKGFAVAPRGCGFAAPFAGTVSRVPVIGECLCFRRRFCLGICGLRLLFQAVMTPALAKNARTGHPRFWLWKRDHN